MTAIPSQYNGSHGSTVTVQTAESAPRSEAPDPRQDAMVRMRRAQDRSFDCEGIPMFLALTRSVGEVPAPADPAVAIEGARLADELDALRSALFPTRRDGDLGCLITTVQALTAGRFEPAATSGASS